MASNSPGKNNPRKKSSKRRRRQKRRIGILCIACAAALFAVGFSIFSYERKKAAQEASEKAAQEQAAEQAAQEQAKKEAEKKAADEQAAQRTALQAEKEREQDQIIVCLDPGHQSQGDSSTEPNGPGSSTMKAKVTGGTHGTTSGLYEYQLTLTIGELLKSELTNRGYTVVMTRETNDVHISNKERAQFATAQGADITVRIHANGSDSSSAHGAMMLVPSSSNPYVSSLASSSKTLAADILSAYCSATGMASQGVSANDTMTGINWSTNPVTIIEMGYMTNPTDDSNMASASFQAKMVSGIADGIDDYFGR